MMYNNFVFFSAAAFSVALLGTNHASAGVIFDNGGPNQFSGNEVTYWVQTEDFVLASNSNLTDAHFWTIESGTWDGVLDYYLFADAGGIPAAAPFTSGAAINISRAATGNVVDGYLYEYAYSFDLPAPVALSGGTTYWFGLHLSNDFDRDEIYWETTDFGLGAYGSDGVESSGGTFDNWYNNRQQHAFYLTTVPEPSGIALASLGLVSVLGYAMRQRRRNAGR